MSVVPDLLPTILPVVDLRITIAGAEIEPGQYVLPSQVRLLIWKSATESLTRSIDD